MKRPGPLGMLVVVVLGGIVASADRTDAASTNVGQVKIGDYVYGNNEEQPTILTALLNAQQVTPTDFDSFIGLTGENISKFALFAAGEAGYVAMLKAVAQGRLDKQTGSTPSSEGTTSIVSKGAATDLLALAVEQGALSRSDNKSVATFSGNALGIGRFVVGADHLPYCAVFATGCPLQSALENLSFSLSFDTSPASGTSSAAATGSNNAVLSGPGPKLSTWTVRYDVNLRRKIAAGDFLKATQDNLVKLKATADDYNKAFDVIYTKIAENDQYKKWEAQYYQEISTAMAAMSKATMVERQSRLREILVKAAVDLVAIARKVLPDFDSKDSDLLVKMGEFYGERDRAFATLLNPITFSVEYDNDHPLNQPTQSSAKLIVSARFDPAGKRQLTFNSTASWYDHAPPAGAVKRFRDAQASLQFDMALTGGSSRAITSFSAGYYFQWMADNALLTIPSGNLAPGTSIALPGDASVLLQTKGTVSIGQIAVTFDFKNGVKFPIALSFANRTELLKANTVRGHFGLTYDLDSLFTKPSGQ